MQVIRRAAHSIQQWVFLLPVEQGEDMAIGCNRMLVVAHDFFFQTTTTRKKPIGGKSVAGAPHSERAGGMRCRRTTFWPCRRCMVTAGAPRKKTRRQCFSGLARSRYSRISFILPAHQGPGAPAVTWEIFFSHTNQHSHTHTTPLLHTTQAFSQPSYFLSISTPNLANLTKQNHIF